MPVDELTKPGELNVTDLETDISRPVSHPFIPERDISPTLVDHMVHVAHQQLTLLQKGEPFTEDIFELGPAVALLFPERKTDLPLDQTLFTKMVELIGRRIEARPELTAIYLFGAGVLFPAERENLNERFIGSGSTTSYLGKLISPETTETLSLDYFNQAKDQLEAIRKSRNNDRMAYAERAAVLRVFFPDKFKELEIDWDFMKEGLSVFHPGGDDFGKLALRMAIAGAEEIVYPVGDKPLQLTMQKPPNATVEATPPMPIERDF